MIPKVEAALAALALGAPFAVVADGRDAAGVRTALNGGGTKVTRH
jgi:acetylglutamate kinase